MNTIKSEEIDKCDIYAVIVSSPCATYYTNAESIESDLNMEFDFSENYRGITIGIVCKYGIYKIIPSITYQTFRVEHRPFITEKVIGHINRYKE